MLPLVIEAVRCLEEGIATSAAEVDMALILGLGFPRYPGGPLKYADWLGMAHVVARCDAYATLGRLYEPTEEMRAAARSGKRRFIDASGGRQRLRPPSSRATARARPTAGLDMCRTCQR
jgi:3-hydroxyacyl-CoA dehydrogenase / enoyl-CoA hydratase / 3-hydroxybutyryl-CoA epimerase / enoyl-CoA isomerase